MKRLTCLILFYAGFSAAEELDINTFIDIDVSTTSLRAYTINSALQCSVGDPIEYLRCGDGTTAPPAGSSFDCSASGAFELEYKVNDVLNCSGSASPSNTDWNGALTIGSGTGAFEKGISGIAVDTMFTLSCNYNSTNTYQLKGIVYYAEMNLSSKYREIAAFATGNKILAWNFLTNQINVVSLNSPIEVSNHMMVRQRGDFIYFVPSTDNAVLPVQKALTNPRYNTLVTLSKYEPGLDIKTVRSTGELAVPISEKCSSFSQKNEAGINLSIGEKNNTTCDVSNLKQTVLSVTVFEK